MRLLCTTLLVTLVSLASCADRNSGFSAPSDPDTTTQGGDPSFGSPGVGDSNPNGVPATDPGADQNAADSDQQDPPEPIPEPSTILLFGLGVTGLAVYRRRRRDEEHQAGSI